ncbi:MAG: hypothetical protein GX607_02500 [Myxococcales bacterium]|jgi:lysophospholipase L1-like esterase|nr:hypothetical protein [Myxococcales bacterium]
MTARISRPDAAEIGPSAASSQGRAAAPVERSANIEAPAALRLLHIGGALALMIGATYVFEPLHGLQPWKRSEGYVPFWNLVGRHLLGEEEALLRERAELEALRRASEAARIDASLAAAQPPPTRPPEETVFPEYVARPGEADPLEVQIEAPEHLDAYYRRLTLVDLQVPILARAAHWGDSLLGDDGLTGSVRRRLQLRFGDGGHGFHVLAPLNPFHMHRGLQFKVLEPWTSRCEVLFRCEKDRRYGLGGVSTRASGEAASRFGTIASAPGDRISRFELWYQTAPHGGFFDVIVDDEPPRRIDTRAEEPTDEVAVFELPDAPHSIQVRAAGRGSVRGYGVVMERGGPGIVWDTLAVIGLSTASLKAQEPEHIRAQISRRGTDLLVFGLGGNDTQRSVADIRAVFEEEYRTVVQRYRAGRPEASCLVVGVTDHADRTDKNGIQTRRSVLEIVEIQRKVALTEGCAFFDLFRAMGGEGTIARWFRAKPALASADLAHPTSAGHEILATLLVRALLHGYVDYRARMVGEPLPEWKELQGREDDGASPSP